MNNDLDFLVEWAVWAHLDSKNDLELTLLKGHLLIEVVLTVALGKHKVDSNDFSFYRKLNILKTIVVKDQAKFLLLISILEDLNRLRNKVAHEYKFDVYDGELEAWASKVLSVFQGEKFRRFTYKLRIIHAFSTIAKNIMDLSIPIYSASSE